MLHERITVIMMALLALNTAGFGVAAGQERNQALPGRVLQQPAPLLVTGEPDLTCTLFIARDQAGTQPIAEGVPATLEAFFGEKPYDRRLATDAPRVWVHRAVKNEGNSGAGPFTGRASVHVFLEGKSPIHIPPVEEAIGPIPPGGSQVLPPLPVELEPETKGIGVDTSYDEPDNAVPESNEGNNRCHAQAQVQTPPAGKPQGQVASQAAQPISQAAAQVAVRHDEEEPEPTISGMAAAAQALIPAAPDVTCTTWASRDVNGTQVIPNGNSSADAVPVEENEIWLHVTVRNLGQAEAQKFNTRSQIYENNVPTPYEDRLMTVEPGLSYRFSAKKVDLCCGPYGGLRLNRVGIHVLTDFPAFALSESDESNNECRAEVWISEPSPWGDGP